MTDLKITLNYYYTVLINTLQGSVLDPVLYPLCTADLVAAANITATFAVNILSNPYTRTLL